MSDTTILHPTDAAHLLSQGLLDKCTTTGSQRLHKRRLNSLSDDEHSKIPLNVSLESEAADDASIGIPASLISYETLRWVGLSEAKATEVWGKWLDWPSDGIQREVDPDDGGLQIYFDEFIIGHTCDEATTATDYDDDKTWQACLEAYGLDREAIEAIMDSHFRDLLRTESPFLGQKHHRSTVRRSPACSGNFSRQSYGSSASGRWTGQ